MTNKLFGLLIASGLVLTGPVACKDENEAADKQEVAVKALDASANGSPVAAEFIGFTGDGDERGLEVLLYNSGDKTAAGYVLVARYYDADDQVLRVKPGTPFEKDTDFTSLSGGRYKCEPQKNATLKVDGRALSVPAEAKRAEILVTKVDAIASDGNTIEDWFSQDNFNEWPD